MTNFLNFKAKLFHNVRAWLLIVWSNTFQNQDFITVWLHFQLIWSPTCSTQTQHISYKKQGAYLNIAQNIRMYHLSKHEQIFLMMSWGNGNGRLAFAYAPTLADVMNY